MIIVTGAAGFIGSNLIAGLNQRNYNHIIAVDKFGAPEKEKNLENKTVLQRVERNDLENWIDANQQEIEFIFHIGARTDTAEFDEEVFEKLNVNYSKMVWEKCVQWQLPLVYASSAATYGLGEQGFSDNEAGIDQLQPLNPYGQSKQDFDTWALGRKKKPFFWAGLKFFNVYGPNEYHKGRMASVVYHAYQQIAKTGTMKLFRSHKAGIADGEQQRDFIFVKDVVEVCLFLMHQRKYSGIYNLGSGKARTFLDLTRAVFRAMGQPETIEFIDTPADIRNTYQYFTEAEMSKLRSTGYSARFTSLEDGVMAYVKHYLTTQRYT